MKKTISILAVLFIAAAVFASGMTAKVGLSYGYGLLNPDFGVGITASPHLGLISVTRDKRRAPHFRILTMPVSVGISYTF